MSSAEVHEVRARTAAEAVDGLAIDVEHAIRELAKPLWELLDEVNQWRNGRYVAWKDDAPPCAGKEVAGIPHNTTTVLDEYGRAPIVQVLPESEAMTCRYRGELVQIVAWAVDADGVTWPMVRTDHHPRPTLVRDADTEIGEW